MNCRPAAQGIRSQYRFFLDPECIQGATVCFPRPVHAQLTRVLRLSAGDRIVVLDGSGYEYLTELTGTVRNFSGIVMDRTLNGNEAPVRVHLFIGVLKQRKFEFVLQKGTELGAVSFREIVCRRSVRRSQQESAGPRQVDIIREAAEQSGRGVLPVMEPPISFATAVSEVEAPALLLTPTGDFHTVPWDDLQFPQTPEDVALFIGPEGGFTPEEVQLAAMSGMIPVSLGPRTLRAETAAIAATAITLARCGALGSAGDSQHRP